MTPDYRKILAAYMRGVVRSYGVTFTVNVRRSALTSDEHRALFEIEDEIKDDPSMKGYWVTR